MDGLAETIRRRRALPVTRQGVSLGSLSPVTRRDADDPRAMARLAAWHLAAFGGVAGPLFFSPEEARRWLIDCVLGRPGRRLFWVRDVRGADVGHLGWEGG
ncbi:MAG: hypothetical protein K2W96_15075, partial [Gemmataceae bacterium]|nr:hypothetical protein [Gemmataceae bacterium]